MSVPDYLLRSVAVAAAIVGLTAAPVFAADQPLPPLLTKAAPVPDVEYYQPQPASAWQADFGARYWFGVANTGKSLYGIPSMSDAMVSRLTYSNLITNSGELFGRIAGTNGLFFKGYVGIGAISGGTLQDEDFPTASFSPYSSTNSDQKYGWQGYGALDIGYDVVRGGDFNLGAFVGYFIFRQNVNAFGCTQTATNPSVCQPAVPSGVEIISQTNTWQSPRVGVDGAVAFAGRFTLSADAAWLPYVRLDGADSHWLRIADGEFSGPIPEDGTGQGYQLEAVLSYAVTPNISVGVGGRYWHLETSGNSHFEAVAVNGGPQPVDWKSDIYGVFLQGSYKFGPYPYGSSLF